MTSRGRRYICGKDNRGHWRVIEIVWVAGEWFPYQHWCFDAYDTMIAAINQNWG